MSPKILIVEDDPGIRDTVADLVEVLGYSHHSANNGKEALLHLENNLPDLIISDIMMPVMDGLEMLMKLKSNARLCTIPVLMLTARADLDTRLESYEIGADGYLVKPFNLQELSYKVKNLITLKENLIREVISDPESIGPQWEFVQSLNSQLESNIGNISLEVLSGKMNLSKSGLQKKLKRYSHQSFQSYVRVYKLAKAKALLESGKCNVSEAADRSGFKSIANFSRSFKEQFGKLPSEIIA